MPALQSDQLLEFRIAVQAIEIGIIGRPILIAVSRGKRFLQRLERFRLLPKDAVSASGIVKSVCIAGAQGHSGLQVTDALVRILGVIRKVGGQ